MRRVEFHPHAFEEFLAAVAFYDARSSGLGASFIGAVADASQSLVEFPRRGRAFGPRLRRVLVSGFPYALLYRTERHGIYIVAVAHLNRRPHYWRDRS